MRNRHGRHIRGPAFVGTQTDVEHLFKERLIQLVLWVHEVLSCVRWNIESAQKDCKSKPLAIDFGRSSNIGA